MSILGVVLGVVGALVALFGAIAGILGGIPAVILGLLAVLFGFLARKKSGKGIPAIVIGTLAVILAVVLMIGGINSAKYQYEQVKAHPEKAPTLAQRLDDVKLQYGYVGLMMVSTNPEEDKVITEEVLALIKAETPKTAATRMAEPATGTEAPTQETAK